MMRSDIIRSVHELDNGNIQITYCDNSIRIRQSTVVEQWLMSHANFLVNYCKQCANIPHIQIPSVWETEKTNDDTVEYKITTTDGEVVWKRL